MNWTIVFFIVLILILIFIGLLVYKIYTLKNPKDITKEVFEHEYDLWKNPEVNKQTKKWVKDYLKKKKK